MNPALLFLLRRSMANWATSRVARLKNPRYLVPTLVGLAYFLLVFGPWRGGGDGPRAPAVESVGRQTGLAVEWLLTGVGLLMAAGAWLLPSRSPPLAFLEAEVAWLFPAPILRRELVHYKLLDVQKYLVLSMAFFALMNTFRAGPLSGATVLLGGWLALNVLTLHQIGARFTLQSLAEHGTSGFRRQAPVLAVVAAFLGVVLLFSPPFPSMGSRPWYEDVSVWLEDLGSSPAGWALYPFRLLARPFFAADLPTFLERCAVLAAVGALLYAWVMRSDVAFEEAAAAHAGKLGRRIEAARKGRSPSAADEAERPARRSPWRLSPEGPPEVAFVWKSVTETLRGISPRLLGILVASAVVGISVAAGSSRRGGGGVLPHVAAFGMLACAGLLVLGSSFLGSSLRGDLENVEALKTLPLRAARLVRGELAGTVLPTALLQVLLVAGAAVVMPSFRTGEPNAAWRLGGAAGLALLLSCLTALSAAVDAAGALLFPAWVRPGQSAAQGGVEGMGYGIVMGLAKFLLLAVGSLVPAGLGGGLVLLLRVLLGPVVLPAAAMLGALVAGAAILAEVFVVTEFLGRRFERLDPAEEGMIQ